MRKRKPVAMLELWKGTVFDHNLPSTTSDVHVILNWVEKELESCEHLLEEKQHLKYVEHVEVRHLVVTQLGFGSHRIIYVSITVYRNSFAKVTTS
jgi:hypothetical protein